MHGGDIRPLDGDGRGCEQGTNKQGFRVSRGSLATHLRHPPPVSTIKWSHLRIQTPATAVHHPGSGARFFQIRHQTNELPHHVEMVEGRHRELTADVDDDLADCQEREQDVVV